MKTPPTNRSNPQAPLCFRLPSFVPLLATSIFLLLSSIVFSCSSPLPPPPPPPPAGPDTTSHDFIWQIDTLGDGNSSVLYDVAIINDTTIWAVGEIYLKDSTGQVDPNLYNVAVWNGSGWKFSRGPLSPFNAVFAFGPHDIWAGTSAPYHWNGTSWTGYNVTGIFGGLITKIWGTSSSDLYIVGTNGSIAHFDGTTWRRIESGTTVDVADIFGLSGTTEAFAVAWGQGTPTRLLKLVGGTHQLLYEDVDFQFVVRSDSLSGRLTSVAAYGSKLFVLSPTGLYETSFDTHGEARRLSFAEAYFPGFPTSVRGTGPNDLFIVGQRSLIAHYNGSTWRWFQNYSNDFVFLNACAARVDVVAAVGQLYISPILSRAVVFVGRR